MRLVLVWFLLLLSLVAAADPAADLAEQLFRAGHFVEAKVEIVRQLQKNPNDIPAMLRLSAIALFSNQLSESERLLKAVLEIDPKNEEAMKALALTYYREDNFRAAAPLYRATGQPAVATKLESLADKTPYQISEMKPLYTIPFVHTDPLPLISVRINGNDPVDFLIDTGGGEIIIDKQYAGKIGLPDFGSASRVFGGGAKAESGQSCIESIELGDLLLKNIPVQTLDTSRFSAAAKGRIVLGILGTSVLYHFISTIDYPGGQLILRPKAEQSSIVADGSIAMPMWMAGDHINVAWGTAENSGPLLFFLDTGMAGGGFTCTESTLKDAGVTLETQTQSQGIAGAGAVKIVPFLLKQATLGDAKETDILGFYGPFPPSLEYQFGFRIAGILSHQFFRPYAVTFDFYSMKLLLKKPAP